MAVTAARRELVMRTGRRAGTGATPFPRPRLALAGEVEALARDPARGRGRAALAEALPPVARGCPYRWSSVGPHRSDLVAADACDGEAAARCSTGRQKAYLISIVLAEARLRLRRHGDLPILLLDEVTAHLDPRRRVELLAALVDLGAQSWLTGTEAAAVRAAAERRRASSMSSNGALTPHE